MSDMLVKLYEVDEMPQVYERLEKAGIRIKRALGMDTLRFWILWESIFTRGGWMNAVWH